jgi:hypothetical protein
MEIAARLRDHFALIHALAALSRSVRGHRGSAPLRGIIDLPGHLAVPLRQREEHRSRTRPERGFRAVHLLVRETQISPGLVGVARHDATQPLRNGMSLPLPAHDREMTAAKTPCCDICAIGGLPHRTRRCEEPPTLGNPQGDVTFGRSRRVPHGEVSRRAGCGKSARPVR